MRVQDLQSVNVLPPRAASAVLARQTLLSTKPLPDLYLCCDIWTPLNRSNSTKERWKMAELEDKKRRKEDGDEDEGCQMSVQGGGSECCRGTQKQTYMQ